MREKLNLLCINLREYTLHWWERMQFDRLIRSKNKICYWPRMKKILAIRFYSLDCDELLSYKKQDYYWPRSLLILLEGDTETKFIDFIGVDKFDAIVSFYLVNLNNCMKTKEKEIQVHLVVPLMSCKYGKKIKRFNRSKYFFIWSKRF